jgi:hypothetical protein
MYHAAAVCWLSTVAIFRQPSIVRNVIPQSKLSGVARAAATR